MSRLSGYLGEGPLQLTNIFSHVNGDGKQGTDFHTAADGKGRTFSVEKVTNYYNSSSGSEVPFAALIGGYDPLSWNSSNSFNVSATDAQRTGFIYNLTTGVEQKQNLINQAGFGQYQTYNSSTEGPLFGGGFDIVVDSDLTTGYANNYSYGGLSFGTNILGNPDLRSYTGGLTFSNLEVFTLGPAAVPEPGAYAFLASLGLTGAAFLRRKKFRG